MDFKKAISPIVAITLLIVITVISAVGFQTWYNIYSSKAYVELEEGSQTSFSDKIEVIDIQGKQILIKNEIAQSYSNFTLNIDGKNCDIGSLSKGVKSYDISNCIENLSNLLSEVVIITQNEVISKKEFIEEGKLANSDDNFIFTPPPSTPDVLHRSCLEIRDSPQNIGSGTYNISPSLLPADQFKVYCDMDYRGGGWTLMLHNLVGNYKYDSVFYNGALDTNIYFLFRGYSMNSKDLEKVISSARFKELSFANYDSSGTTYNLQWELPYNSTLPDTTFVEKKNSLSGWTSNFAGAYGTPSPSQASCNNLNWNLAYSGSYTYTRALLGCQYPSGFGDVSQFGIGTRADQNAGLGCVTDLGCGADISIGYVYHRGSSRLNTGVVWIR